MNSNYYGSPLNEFIGLHCERNHTCINIDCLQLKLRNAGVDNIIRVVEYKHEHEKVGDMQLRALQTLATLFKTIRDSRYKFQVCVFYGNEPFQRARIKDLTNNQDFELKNQEEIKNWLAFGGGQS